MAGAPKADRSLNRSRFAGPESTGNGDARRGAAPHPAWRTRATT